MGAMSKMQLAEIEPLIEKLITKIDRMETAVDMLLGQQKKPSLPEWANLKQCSEYAGVSYNTLRRSEYIDRRPNGGRSINGVTKYPRAQVIEWARNLGK